MSEKYQRERDRKREREGGGEKERERDRERESFNNVMKKQQLKSFLQNITSYKVHILLI